MNTTLSPELKKQIAVESIKYESATQHEGLGPAIYRDGAIKYALKWELAEQLIEQMAKALEEVKNGLGAGWFTKIANEALTDYNNYKNGKDGA